MPASMIAPVECTSTSPVPPAESSTATSPAGECASDVASDREDRVSPNPWQDRRGEVRMFMQVWRGRLMLYTTLVMFENLDTFKNMELDLVLELNPECHKWS